MINLFLTLIVIFAFICITAVIIGIKSRKTVYPMVSVICGVMIIACALCCTIETEPSDSSEVSTKAYIPVTENKSVRTEAAAKTEAKIKKEIPAETEQAETFEINEPEEEIQTAERSIPVENDSDDMNRIVYITKTGTKYHYSYFCSNTDFYECTLEQALERGLEPCKKCVK